MYPKESILYLHNPDKIKDIRVLNISYRSSSLERVLEEARFRGYKISGIETLEERSSGCINLIKNKGDPTLRIVSGYSKKGEREYFLEIV